MQKYIAVVNPSMDEDEITRLIRKGIAGALFEISHENYPVAMRLIALIKELAAKYRKPISIIQDVSGMQDKLDLEVGLKSGVNWVASDKEEHLKMARGLNKLAGLIYKGRNLPKSVKVDSAMDSSFVDPDAMIGDTGDLGIKHLTTDHGSQHILDTLLRLAHAANTQAIAVSDLGFARALSFRRPSRKIILATPDGKKASYASIFWGIHPVVGEDAQSAIRNSDVLQKGKRIMDATNPKHIEIHVI